jgi:hypothetical protein
MARDACSASARSRPTTDAVATTRLTPVPSRCLPHEPLRFACSAPPQPQHPRASPQSRWGRHRQEPRRRALSGCDRSCRGNIVSMISRRIMISLRGAPSTRAASRSLARLPRLCTRRRLKARADSSARTRIASVGANGTVYPRRTCSSGACATVEADRFPEKKASICAWPHDRLRKVMDWGGERGARAARPRVSACAHAGELGRSRGSACDSRARPITSPSSRVTCSRQSCSRAARRPLSTDIALVGFACWLVQRWRRRLPGV